jgi:hypothetical protein
MLGSRLRAVKERELASAVHGAAASSLRARAQGARAVNVLHKGAVGRACDAFGRRRDISSTR